MADYASHTAKMLAELGPEAVPSEVQLTIEQRVTSGDSIIEQFHVRLADGTATVVEGPALSADVIIRQDEMTARALRSGEIHAQRAFLTGQLFIDGDIDKLLAHGDLLSTLLRGGDA